MKLKDLLKIIPKSQFYSVTSLSYKDGYVAVIDEKLIESWKDKKVLSVEANTDDLCIEVE